MLSIYNTGQFSGIYHHAIVKYLKYIHKERGNRGVGAFIFCGFRRNSVCFKS
ncbi:hypothetical protein METHB2_150049 [Candidatus Methylobacter favarea]|uniref:Uncharacterized protein n=1 Tax=Candidatus Methylobacter favarea TaxID=2707345 RepID=A0A8S0WZ27_9GAMM|nr:hypothetical protein METHB2_150049 [Candidatus Methylobacter favarea]